MNNKLRITRKILFSILFIICLFLFENINEVNAASAPEYRWPIGGDNANETYIEYKYYGLAGQAPIKDGKSGREYIVNNELWPNELNYYNSCESHLGVDITGINGHNYKVVSVVEGVVIATNAEYGYNPNKVFEDRNQRNTSASFIQSEGGGYGNYIIIQENSTGKCFLYAHLRGGTLKVATGDSVHVGQEIATMGSSGDAGHMHLHFEVRTSKQAIMNMSWGLGRHTFQIANSSTNIDPEELIGSSPNCITQIAVTNQKQTQYIPPKRSKVTFQRFSKYRKINIYFDKPVVLGSKEPTVKVKVLDEIKDAEFIGISDDGLKLMYKIKYDDFDIFTEGVMYVDCTGTVLDKENINQEVDCKFKNLTIGKLYKCSLSQTFSAIINNGKGDINGDGKVNALDATSVLRIYVSIVADEELSETDKRNLDKADVNNDGKVNAIDATIILSYYANKSAGITLEDDKRVLKCDLNADNKVNVEDYNLLKTNIDKKLYSEKYDLNDDGKLDNNDIEFFRNVMYDLGSRSIS